MAFTKVTSTLADTLNQNTTGNAATATALASARTIGGTSFDGTGNIAVATATEATNVTVSANNSTDETVYPAFVDGATGTQGIETDTGLTYNPSTGDLTTAGQLGGATLSLSGNATVGGNLTVTGTTTQVNTVTMNAQNAVVFEGSTADNYETTLSIVDPTADHTQYLINQGGYIPVLAAVSTTAISATPAELNLLDGSTANSVVNSKALIYGSSGQVAATTIGVGVTSNIGNAKVHIKEAASGYSGSSSNNTELTIENDNNTGIQFLTPNNKSSGLWFGDPDAAERAKFYYSHASDHYQFNAAATNVMTLSGTLLALTGNQTISGTLGVTGAATFSSTITSGHINTQITHTSTDVTAANSNSTLRIGNTGTGNGVYNAIKFAANQQDMYIMAFNDQQQADRRIGFFVGSVAGDAVADERLSILGDGKVGIGTTSPEAGLHVVGGIHMPNASSISFDQAAGNLRNAILVDSGDDMIIGDTNFDDIYFSTGQKTKTVVIKQTTGNVGIGLTGPSTLLHLKETGSTSAVNEFIRMENHALGGTGAGSSINFHHYHGGGGPSGGAKAAAITAVNTANWAGGTPSSYSTDLTFGNIDANTFAEKMRIDSGGRMLIGHTASITGINSMKLQLNATDSTSAIQLGRWTNNAYGGYVSFVKSRSGTIGSHTIVQDSDGLGHVMWSGDNGSNFSLRAAAIKGVVDGTPSSTVMPGRIEFLTATTTWDENNIRMVIKNDGKIGIGTTSPGELLHLSAATGDAVKMKIQSTGSATSDDVQLTMINHQADWSLGIDQSSGGHYKLSRHETLGNYNAWTVTPDMDMSIGRDPVAGVRLFIQDAQPEVIIGNSTQDGSSTLLRLVEPYDADTRAGMYFKYDGSGNKGYIGGHISGTDTEKLVIPRDPNYGIHGQVLATGNGTWGNSGAWGNVYDTTVGGVVAPVGSRYFWYIDLQGLDGYTSWGYVHKDRNGRWRVQTERQAGTNFQVESSNRYFQTQQGSGANQANSSGAFRLVRLMGHDTTT